MEEPIFFLEIDFLHERNIASAWAQVVSLSSYQILIKQNFN